MKGLVGEQRLRNPLGMRFTVLNPNNTKSENLILRPSIYQAQLVEKDICRLRLGNYFLAKNRTRFDLILSCVFLAKFQNIKVQTEIETEIGEKYKRYQN